ncbi:MAG: aminopeptidase, partial [Thermoplasmata archaeon]
MQDIRIERLAKVLVSYSLGLTKGEVLQIEGPSLAAPLIKAVYKEALLAGAHPYARTTVEGLVEIFYEYSSDEQLRHIFEAHKSELKKLNALLTIWGDWNTKKLKSVDPKRIALRENSKKVLYDILLQR